MLKTVPSLRALCVGAGEVRGKSASSRLCLTRARARTKDAGFHAHQRATVGEQDTRKSICADSKRAAAVMQLTAGSHFFNYLITLN